MSFFDRPWRAFWTLRDPGTFLGRAGQTLEAAAWGVLLLALSVILLSASGVHFRTPGEPGGFWLLVVLVPMLETLLMQTLPASVSRSLGWPRWLCLLSMVLCFGILHVVLIGGAAGLLVGSVLGWVFGSVYAIHMDRSWLAAVGWTFMVHGLHNGVVWAVYA